MTTKKVAGKTPHQLRREAEQERDALRADAERYRLLRRGQRWSVVNGIGDVLRANALDAAIDIARKEGAQHAQS